jgi:hypothetical protein
MRSPILSTSPTGRAFARAAGAAIDAARLNLVRADRTEPASWTAAAPQRPAPRQLARVALTVGRRTAALTLSRGRGALSFRLSIS